MLIIFADTWILVPRDIFVGCSVLAGQWAFIYSSFVFTRTSALFFFGFCFSPIVCVLKGLLR